MFLCKVVGTIVSTARHSTYERQRILVVRQTKPDGTLHKGTMVVLDAIGTSGVGDWVLVASEGRGAYEIFEFDHPVPIREFVVGLIDRVEMKVGGRACGSGLPSTEKA